MQTDRKELKLADSRILQLARKVYSDKISHSDILSRFLHGTFWSFAGAVASRVFTLGAFIVVARMLGKEEFGKLGIIQVTVAMFQIFAGFGLGLTATKYVSEFRKEQPDKAGRIVALSQLVAAVFGGALTVALVIFARPLAVRSLGSPELAPELRIASLIVFFLALNGYQVGTLAGLERFKAVAQANLMVGLFSFVSLVLGTYSFGLRGAVWGLVAGSFLNWAITQWKLKSELNAANIRLDFRRCASEVGLLAHFSLPAILAGAMVVPVNWLCSAMLVRSSGGYGEMGIYNAMNQWFAALLFLPTVLEQVTLPMISERFGAQDHRQSRRLLRMAVKANIVIVAPLVFLGTVASPIIVRLYGPHFHNSTRVLVVILITAGLYAVQAPVGQLVAAYGQMWFGFLMNLAWAITMLSSTTLLLRRGAFGLALARMIAYLAHCIWTIGSAYVVLRRSSPVVTVCSPANLPLELTTSDL